MNNEIFYAVITQDLDILAFILQRPRNHILHTDAVNEHGQCPLDFALMGNPSFGVVDILLRAGANVTSEHVVVVAQHRRQDIFHVLCRSRPGLMNRPNQHGWFPLQLALTKPYCCESTIRFLLLNGANPNLSRPWPALHIAVLCRQNQSVINHLLNNDADPNAINWNGQTVLHAGT